MLGRHRKDGQVHCLQNVESSAADGRQRLLAGGCCSRDPRSPAHAFVRPASALPATGNDIRLLL
jgi:hypothetical protein